MEKVSNEKKLESVKNWLKKNKVEFVENHKSHRGLLIDLWIPKLFIAIHVGDDQDFYEKTFRWSRPFFIREEESLEFVIEKLENCCYERMMFMQRLWQKKQYQNKKKKEAAK